MTRHLEVAFRVAKAVYTEFPGLVGVELPASAEVENFIEVVLTPIRRRSIRVRVLVYADLSYLVQGDRSEVASQEPPGVDASQVSEEIADLLIGIGRTGRFYTLRGTSTHVIEGAPWAK
jgi:hypothetical protein